MTYQDIMKASEDLQTMPIKGKEYVTVNERVKAFRKLLPDGTISTEIVQVDENMVVIVARVYDGGRLLSTGTAFEIKDASYINKTSYIENCETSAVGRALAFLGIGIDSNIASSDETENAVEQQTAIKPIGAVKANALRKKLEEANVNIPKLMENYKIENLSELTEAQHYRIAQGVEERLNGCKEKKS